MSVCRWCKNELFDDSLICTHCGKWQSLWRYWLWNSPTILFGVISAVLAVLLYLQPHLDKSTRLEIESRIETVESLISACNASGATPSPWCKSEWQHDIAWELIELSIEVREKFVGSERRSHLNRIEASLQDIKGGTIFHEDDN